MSKKEEFLKSYSFDKEDIATGIFAVDGMLCGGFAPGSITTFVAESGIGKSTIALQTATKLAERGFTVLYIDSEGSISQKLILSTGATYQLDKKLFYIRKSTFSEVEEVIDYYLENTDIQFIFIDSISCLIHDGFVNLNKSKSKRDKAGISITTNNSNYNSRRFGLFMNKYNSIIKQRNLNMVLINQYRNKVDMQVGTILTMASGKAVRYMSDVIISIALLKGTGKYKDFKDIKKSSNGTELEFEIVKSNRLAPHKRLPFYLQYGHGIANLYSYIYYYFKIGFLKESNNYFTLSTGGSEIKFHGADELNQKLHEYVDNNTAISVLNYYINEVSDTH